MNKNVFRQTFIWIPLVLAFVLIQSGCASKTYWTWEHNELTTSQMVKDRQECRQLARIEADNHDFFYNYRYDPFYWPHHSRKHYYNSYWDWNWYRHDRFIRYQDSLDRYFYICMKAKGWERVKKIKQESPDPNKTSE